ncbi:MAG: hypothetical protein HXS41_02790 [Theionarchaea archaeon]|nr:hypothetical protein [Theionarchaea archaeon]MBU7001182.1 hypothetical protein [Theionarchaea archaeon]MBU7019961.1 hypothetical protein [Theionarchaea archaeon]MBU7034053.1 hypothetical protein [Theionarchaea archaeon]
MADNFIMKVYLKTVQNIVGINGLNSVLNYAHLQKYINNSPPDNGKLETPVKDIQNLFHALYELFGENGTRNLSLRLGREFAREAIEERSSMMETLSAASGPDHEERKTRMFLDTVAQETGKMFTCDSGNPVEIQEHDDHFFIIHRDYFESNGLQSDDPVCNVYVGMLEYFMYWITGARHEVKEIECKAMGNHADVFRISKNKKIDAS